MLRVLTRSVRLQGAGRVVHASFGNCHLHVTVALQMHNRTFWGIYRDLLKIGPTKTAKLRVLIGENTALQKGIIREIDTRNHVPDAESDLFCLGKEVVYVAIQHQPAHDAEWQNLLRDDLCRVENIEIKLASKLFVKELKAQFPLRKISTFNCVPQIPAVKIRIGS